MKRRKIKSKDGRKEMGKEILKAVGTTLGVISMGLILNGCAHSPHSHKPNTSGPHDHTRRHKHSFSMDGDLETVCYEDTRVTPGPRDDGYRDCIDIRFSGRDLVTVPHGSTIEMTPSGLIIRK